MKRRRPGLSLLEVLIAIFVMGIGLLALLTLFPVGALSMRQAVLDNRCGQAAINARAVASILDVRNHLQVVGAMTGTNPPRQTQPQADGPSYPVYVDPVGVATGLNPLGNQISRVNMGLDVPSSIAWMSLTDDVVFDNGGNATTPFARTNRFTWAYLVRRPKTGEGVAHVTTVVYSNRPLVTPNDDSVAYAVTAVDPQAPSVTIQTTGTVPAVRPGTWVLDASPSTTPAELAAHGPVHGYFYRIAGVTDLGGGQLRLDLQTPLRAVPTTITVMEDVAEVFEQGTGWKP